MTAYGQRTTTQAATSLPSHGIDEKKAARKKLLDEIFRRRAENYKRFYSKMAPGQAK